MDSCKHCAHVNLSAPHPSAQVGVALPSDRTGSGNDGTVKHQEEWWGWEYVDVIVSCVTATDNVCIRFAVYDVGGTFFLCLSVFACVRDLGGCFCGK